VRFRIVNDAIVEDALVVHIASEFLEWLETKGYAVAYAGSNEPYDSYAEMGAGWVQEVKAANQ